MAPSPTSESRAAARRAAAASESDGEATPHDDPPPGGCVPRARLVSGDKTVAGRQRRAGPSRPAAGTGCHGAGPPVGPRAGRSESGCL